MNQQARLREKYDWIAMGDNPGALLSAVLAARLGLSVLILPLGPRFGVQFSKIGQPLDPEPNFILGLGRAERTNGLLLQCLSHVGISPADSGMIRMQEAAAMTVVTPSTRVTYGMEAERTQQELLRELGPEATDRLAMGVALTSAQEEIAEFWFQLPERLKRVNKKQPPALAKQLRELNRKLSRIPDLADRGRKHWLSPRWKISDQARATRPELEPSLEGLWHALTSEGGSNPDFSRLLHAASLGRTAAQFRGGVAGLREFLLQLAQRSGAHVPEGSECAQIFLEGGKFSGVQVSQRGNVISAVGGILGASLEHGRAVITTSGSSLSKKLKPAPKPSGWRFTVSFLVRRDAFPVLPSRRVIWQEPGAPTLEIEFAEPADYDLAAPESVLLFARAWLPFNRECITSKYQRLIAGRMLRQLSELFPFLEYHITKIYPDFGAPGITALDELAECYRFQSLSDIPENLRTYRGEGIGAESGIEGLFVASSESYPQWGSFGPTVAALKAVGWLAERFDLAGPLV